MVSRVSAAPSTRSLATPFLTRAKSICIPWAMSKSANSLGRITFAAGGPSLKSFVRKSKALSLYRELFRVSNLFPKEDRSKIQNEIREGFKANRNEEDQIAIGYLLSKGEEQLNFLKSGSLNMNLNCQDSVSKIKPSTDSWLGQGTPDDEHGRVGVGWPFNRNSHS
eukprot:g7019.t1